MIGRTRGMISEWEPKIEQVVSNFLDVLQCCLVFVEQPVSER